METMDYTTLIQVAWELGNVKFLEMLAKKLIVGSWVNEDGQLCYKESGNWELIAKPSMPLIPDDLFGRVLLLVLTRDWFRLI